MKKLTAVGLALVGFAVAGYSQGTVTFQNNASTLVTIDGVGPAPVGTITVGLYAGTSPDALTLVPGSQTEIAPVPGRFNAGAITLPGVAGGSMVTLQVRAWSTAAGASYEEALATGNPSFFAGLSTTWTQATGNPGGDPPTASVPILPGFTGAVLTPVPEPSTVILAVLGGLGLLLFRRRK